MRSTSIRVLVAAWLALLPCSTSGCRRGASPPPGAPNVLLVVVDTLRADHLHLYGYPRRTSDHIDALGASGWVFESHIASSAQTVPSTLSMLLSMQPAEHGFLHLGEGHFGRHRPRYPDGLVFLAEAFQAAGYRTGGFVGNPFLQRDNGFAQGFDHFVYSEERGEVLTSAATDWMTRRDWRERPFFAYVHYFDVHSPYEPPAPYRDLFERPEEGRYIYRNGPAPEVREADVQTIVSLYDGEIAYVNDQIGDVLSALEGAGVREDTLIAVTSDHGDEFLEHGGLGHGTSVYGELVRVPLILTGPGIDDPGRRIDDVTHHLDLAPSLLALAGLEPPASFRGGDLTTPPARAFADDGPWLGVYAGKWKLVLDRSTGETATFAVTDKLDRQPLDAPAATRELLEHARWYAELKRAPEAGAAPPDGAQGAPVDWTQQEVERLKALGYVE